MGILRSLVILLFVGIAFGSEKFDPRVDIIADNYEAGPFLIYDCKEKHWTCVEESYFTDCKAKRTREIASDANIHHSCAPFDKFPTKRGCYDRQLFMASQDFGTRFCVRDYWKDKVIKD